MKINKKLIAFIIIPIIIIIGLIVILVKNNSKSHLDSGKLNYTKTLEFSQVFELENVDKSNYEIEKTSDLQIASKYLTGLECYELKANVNMDETIGKMYYVRESYSDLNIFQTKYNINEYDNIDYQVENIIDNFDMKIQNYIGITDEITPREELQDLNIKKLEIPLGEAIYYKEKQYTKKYEIEDRKYEVNFYKSGNSIVCELVWVR